MRKRLNMNYENVYLVLGGGLLQNGGLPNYIVQRVKYCISEACTNDAIVFSSRYSLNSRPKLDERGFPKSEAKTMLDYYVNNEGGSKNLYLENASTDTIGSALFTRLLFGGLFQNKKLTVITSDFHLSRVTIIFEKVFLNLSHSLNFKELKFVGTQGPKNLQEREEREDKQIKLFKEEYMNIVSLNEFMMHMLTFHDNYSKDYQSDISPTKELLY